MTNEEAKKLYQDAVRKFKGGAYQSALALLDELDNERPNSRQVTLHRGLCFVKLGKLDEADECRRKLDGKLDDESLDELRDAIVSAKTAVPSTVGAATAGASTVHPADSVNVLVVEAVFPASADEATVKGYVESGVFRTGDMPTLVTPQGLPVMAPIVRIGTAETPLNLVREGQQTVMLLKVQPNYISPGTRITCTAHEESYAKTMVVANVPPSSLERLTGDLVEIEKMVKQRKYEDARAAVERYLETDPHSSPAYRFLAQVRIDGPEGTKDAKAGLEAVRKAYELGGANDPAVIDLLAKALALNGEAQQGLRFLERLHEGDLPLEARMALANRIAEYRNTHGLGHVWEFADEYGEVLFETTETAEIVKAIKNKTIASSAKCRRDRIGEWRLLEHAFDADHPEIAALLGGGAGKAAEGGSSGTMWTAILVILVVAIAAVVAFAMFK